MSKWNLIIDVGRCENCHNCVHRGRATSLSATTSRATRRRTPPQATAPIRIQRRVRGSGAHGRDHLPAGHVQPLRRRALHARRPATRIRKRDDGIVIIDPVKAQGPAGPRRRLPVRGDRLERGAAAAADLVLRRAPARPGLEAAALPAGLPDRRLRGGEARRRRDGARRRRAKGCACSSPQLGTRPRVWYRGLERWETCFVGGSVSAEVDGVAECVEGAEVIALAGRRAGRAHAHRRLRRFPLRRPARRRRGLPRRGRPMPSAASARDCVVARKRLPRRDQADPGRSRGGGTRRPRDRNGVSVNGAARTGNPLAREQTVTH